MECVTRSLLWVEEYRSKTCRILSMVSYTIIAVFQNIRSMYTIDGRVINA